VTCLYSSDAAFDPWLLEAYSHHVDAAVAVDQAPADADQAASYS